jgi:hypothetical protein
VILFKCTICGKSSLRLKTPTICPRCGINTQGPVGIPYQMNPGDIEVIAAEFHAIAKDGRTASDQKTFAPIIMTNGDTLQFTYTFTLQNGCFSSTGSSTVCNPVTDTYKIPAPITDDEELNERIKHYNEIL